MRRREFISLLGGASAWPLAVRAQQAERVRFVGILMDTAESNQEGRTRIAAFGQSLHAIGWMEGRNIRIDRRWAGGDVDRARRYAEELVGLKPDVIFTFGNAQLLVMHSFAHCHTQLTEFRLSLSVPPTPLGQDTRAASRGQEAT
jgi:hypothetical protein